MFYKLLIHYFRLKILRIFLSRIKGNRFVKSKNLKTINIITYGLELLSSLFLKPKK